MLGHPEAPLLGPEALVPLKNSYGDNIVFIRCISHDMEHGFELLEVLKADVS